MTAALLAAQFELTHRTAHVNLNGVTHEESLVHPAPAGNCMNWVAGHIVATRNLLLHVLGEPPIWPADTARPYERGAASPLRAEGAQRLEDILAALDRSQPLVVERLRALGDD